jgi:hypothetical protein
MLNSMRYGTYIFFGALTTLGAGFIYFFVPETKSLTLEEMDILFGSVGVAAADAERMKEINREVGLDRFHQGESGDVAPTLSEKPEKLTTEQVV